MTVLRPGRTGVVQELRDVWAYRELLRFLTWRNLKIRYKQTLVGATWALVQPAALGLVFSLFLGRYIGVPSDGLPHPVFFMCTVLPWSYMSAALLGTTGSLVDHQNLITKVYFPRILLPMSAVLTGLADFAIGLIGLAVVMVVFSVPVSWSLALAPVAVMVAIITVLGAGLWLSAANAYYRDVRYAVPFLIQLLMFASPVLYPASLIHPRWQALYALNPVTGVIETFRWSVTGTGEPPGRSLLIGLAVALLVLGTGQAFFRRVEDTLADIV